MIENKSKDIPEMGRGSLKDCLVAIWLQFYSCLPLVVAVSNTRLMAWTTNNSHMEVSSKPSAPLLTSEEKMNANHLENVYGWLWRPCCLQLLCVSNAITREFTPRSNPDCLQLELAQAPDCLEFKVNFPFLPKSK